MGKELTEWCALLAIRMSRVVIVRWNPCVVKEEDLIGNLLCRL